MLPKRSPGTSGAGLTIRPFPSQGCHGNGRGLGGLGDRRRQSVERRANCTTSRSPLVVRDCIRAGLLSTGKMMPSCLDPGLAPFQDLLPRRGRPFTEKDPRMCEYRRRFRAFAKTHPQSIMLYLPESGKWRPPPGGTGARRTSSRPPIHHMSLPRSIPPDRRQGRFSVPGLWVFLP